MKQTIHQIGLTESQISDLFSILDRWDEEQMYLSDHDERRHNMRFPFALRTVAVLCEINQNSGAQARDAYQVRVRNVSTGGASFIHGVHMRIGQQVEVEFPCADVTVQGHISHTRPLIDPIREYGVTYDEPINVRKLVETGIR